MTKKSSGYIATVMTTKANNRKGAIMNLTETTEHREELERIRDPMVEIKEIEIGMIPFLVVESIEFKIRAAGTPYDALQDAVRLCRITRKPIRCEHNGRGITVTPEDIASVDSLNTLAKRVFKRWPKEG